MASRVRQLIGMPSMTWVPRVLTRRPGERPASRAPAITERAALPVQSVTMCGTGARLEELRRSSGAPGLCGGGIPVGGRAGVARGAVALAEVGGGEPGVVD